MKTLSAACLIVVLFTAASGAQTDPPAAENVVKTYGSAIVEKVIAVDNIYTFRCDVKGWPDVIGADISIKINGITEPAIVANDPEPNRFFQAQAKKFLAAHLSNSKTITLQNIKRGKDFSLIADIITDSNSLADILIENELARKFTEEEIIAIQNPPAPKILQAINTNNQTPKIKTTTATHYVASKSSKVFHEPSCRFARSMDEKTAIKFSTQDQAIRSGRRKCKICGK